MMRKEKCPDCKSGYIHRDHVCEEYVVCLCDNSKCSRSEMEHFSEMDDDGWAWLREQYKREL